MLWGGKSLAHRNRGDFCDLRLRCPSRTPEIARFPREDKTMLPCDLRLRWKVASDLRFRAAISEPKTPSFCGISGDLAQSTRKSLAIAIVRFWCAKGKSLRGCGWWPWLGAWLGAGPVLYLRLYRINGPVHQGSAAEHHRNRWEDLQGSLSEPIFGEGMRRSTFQWKKGFSVKRGEAIQWMRGLVRISTGKAIQWRGPGHSVNRRTLKSEKLLSSSPSRKSTLTLDILRS